MSPEPGSMGKQIPARGGSRFSLPPLAEMKNFLSLLPSSATQASLRSGREKRIFSGTGSLKAYTRLKCALLSCGILAGRQVLCTQTVLKPPHKSNITYKKLTTSSTSSEIEGAAASTIELSLRCLCSLDCKASLCRALSYRKTNSPCLS